MKRQRDDTEEDGPRGARPGGGGSDHNKRGRATYDQPRGPPRRNDADRGEKVEVRTLKDERETDPHRLAQRQKQIDYGKNTLGYDRYCSTVPRRERIRGKHPMTPDKTLNVSKKQFDGMVRRWRQALHDFDPPELKERLEAAEQAAGAAAPASTAVVATAAAGDQDGADSDPELADLDPSMHTAESKGPSIFDTFQDDEDVAVDNEDDDDDDLL